MKTAIYIRVAAKPQDDIVVQHQRDGLTKYAKDNGLEIVQAYEDIGFSGLDLNRPSYKRLEADYADGKFETVLVTDVSRLSRIYMEYPFPIQTLN